MAIKPLSVADLLEFDPLVQSTPASSSTSRPPQLAPLQRPDSPLVVRGEDGSDPLSVAFASSKKREPTPVASSSSIRPPTSPRRSRINLAPTRRLSSSTQTPTVSASDFVAAFSSSPPARPSLERHRQASGENWTTNGSHSRGTSSDREKPEDGHTRSESFDDFVGAASSTVISIQSRIRAAIADMSIDEAPRQPIKSFSGAPGFAGEKAEAYRSTPRGQTYDSTVEAQRPIILDGVRPGLRSSLDEDLAEAIRPALPPRLRLARSWTLLYSLDQHGVSISTLYARVKAGARLTEAPCLLLVRDTNGHRFGGFVNEPFRRSEHYYGSGESFLWRADEFKPGDFRVGVAAKAYHWTGQNTYCVLSGDDALSFGGGDGRFGLWVDAAMERCVSAPCPTFNNEILCSHAAGQHKEGSASVLALEVWRIGT